MVRLEGVYAGISTRNQYMFQFLMVRLEARGTIIPAASTTVSIPYGSIRRGNFGQDSELLILFQFLMVRLEETTDQNAL